MFVQFEFLEILHQVLVFFFIYLSILFASLMRFLECLPIQTFLNHFTSINLFVFKNFIKLISKNTS